MSSFLPHLKDNLKILTRKA